MTTLNPAGEESQVYYPWKPRKVEMAMPTAANACTSLYNAPALLRLTHCNLHCVQAISDKAVHHEIASAPNPYPWGLRLFPGQQQFLSGVVV